MTFCTPSSAASLTVLRKSRRRLLAISASGWSGLPWQERALISSPRSSTLRRNPSMAPASSSSLPGSQWASPGYPPVPISTASQPASLT